MYFVYAFYCIFLTCHISFQKMCGHLRLLNIACAAKAKPRLVTLTKPSRDSPLAFSLLGGQEKGFRIFIDAVEPGSKAAEVGLKRGDQVKYLPQTEYIVSAVRKCRQFVKILGFPLPVGNCREGNCKCSCT